MTMRGKAKEETFMISSAILRYFSIRHDPFGAEIPPPAQTFSNQAIRDAENAVMAAVLDRGFLLLCGEVGSGKSTLLRKVLRRLESERNLKICMPAKLFVERIGSGFIADAAIQDFGGLPPPVNLRRRALVLREVIERNQRDNTNLALIIDEAQGLHPNTLRALKRFWEGVGGESSTLAVVLIGQPSILATLAAGSMAEVQLRLQAVELNPFAGGAAEIATYVDHRLRLAGGPSGLFRPEAVRLLAERAHTPLQVNRLCRQALITAWRLKEKTIGEEVMDSL